MSFDHIDSVIGNNDSITFNIRNNFFSTSSSNFIELLFGIVDYLEIPSLRGDSSITVIFSDYSDYLFFEHCGDYFELVYNDLPQYYTSSLDNWIYNWYYPQNTVKKEPVPNPWVVYKRKTLLTDSIIDELKVNAETNRINNILGIQNNTLKSILRKVYEPNYLFKGRELFNLEYKEKIAKLHFLHLEMRRHEENIHINQLNAKIKQRNSEKKNTNNTRCQSNKQRAEKIRVIGDLNKVEEDRLNQKRDEKRKYWGSGII